MPDYRPPFFRGYLIYFDRDSLVMSGDSVHPRLRIPTLMLRRVELSRGPSPLLTVSIPVSLGLAGALLAPRILTEPEGCEFRPEDLDCLKQTPDGVVGLGAGLIAGLILAHLVVPERWTEVPLDLFLIGGRDRPVAIGVAFTFTRWRGLKPLADLSAIGKLGGSFCLSVNHERWLR
jgi:hypothetical protein